MNDMNKATLDYYVELIDNKLLELTHSKPELQGQVVEAMEYAGRGQKAQTCAYA